MNGGLIGPYRFITFNTRWWNLSYKLCMKMYEKIWPNCPSLTWTQGCLGSNMGWWLLIQKDMTVLTMWREIGYNAKTNGEGRRSVKSTQSFSHIHMNLYTVKDITHYFSNKQITNFWSPKKRTLVNFVVYVWLCVVFCSLCPTFVVICCLSANFVVYVRLL